MASTVFISTHFILQLLLVSSLLFHTSFGARKLTGLFQSQSPSLKYHGGLLLSGHITINIYWYGGFNASQRAIISDFITSISSPPSPQPAQSQAPSVAEWFDTTKKYYTLAQGRNVPSSLSVSLGIQILDEYSLGKSLTQAQIKLLASKGYQTNAIVIVLTSADVTVQNFCMICGTHGFTDNQLVYIWVGNSETQCPGACAWPFHQPPSGPEPPPLIPPNGDVGCDGIVINTGSLLVGAITNPYGDGIYQGVAGAGKEAASACAGKYATGAFQGYPGKLLVDPTTGGSYNAVGANGREYCLPEVYDPTTSSCSTLV